MSPELAARAWKKERREYLPNSPERDWKIARAAVHKHFRLFAGRYSASPPHTAEGLAKEGFRSQKPDMFSSASYGSSVKTLRVLG